MGRFDVVNGGLVVLAALAALNPTLLALRIVLLVPVLIYLDDASRMHTEFVATGHVHPGIELW
ncbi:hypothetical protein [Lichenibacterium dinghuense]|uniref:hypothetical protein n=1 Tax=Lichenibacterium dinghuense TaxID=2895977 RepID=UPI001F39583D|nr:hypothetical protein [Lichenibacterium sp. 6Y81]